MKSSKDIAIVATNEKDWRPYSIKELKFHNCFLTCSSLLPGLCEQTYAQSDTSYPQLSPYTSAPDLTFLGPTYRHTDSRNEVI